MRRAGALDDLSASDGYRLRVQGPGRHRDQRRPRRRRRAFAEVGRIDVVVSNAGYGLFGAAEEVTGDQIDRQIATNLLGSIQLIRGSLPHLRRQGGGRILQASSEGGQIAYPNFSLYHATKWGIEGLVEAVAQEVAPCGIDIVLVELGATATNFGASLDRAPSMPVYDNTPAGMVWTMVANGSFAIRGDVGRTVDAMIVAADSAKPALRLALGVGTFERLSSAFSEHLSSLQNQKAVALAVDIET
jgi:NAD(P)-dependent dehydrogenase (short-subunit alcohol dehydrogenase family)